MTAVAAGGSDFQAAMSTTASAPTSATDGLGIIDLAAVTVVVQAESTRTLSGSGTLDCYLYDAVLGDWVPCPSLNLNVTSSGVNAQAFPAFDIPGPRNARVKWIPNGVGVSAGSTVTVSLLGYDRTNKLGYR